jgi:hypothetical protein
MFDQRLPIDRMKNNDLAIANRLHVWPGLRVNIVNAAGWPLLLGRQIAAIAMNGTPTSVNRCMVFERFFSLKLDLSALDQTVLPVTVNRSLRERF